MLAVRNNVQPDLLGSLQDKGSRTSGLLNGAVGKLRLVSQLAEGFSLEETPSEEEQGTARVFLFRALQQLTRPIWCLRGK